MAANLGRSQIRGYVNELIADQAKKKKKKKKNQEDERCVRVFSALWITCVFKFNTRKHKFVWVLSTLPKISFCLDLDLLRSPFIFEHCSTDFVVEMLTYKKKYKVLQIIPVSFFLKLFANF